MIKIGLETHVQLSTKTKLFCNCPVKEDEPNKNICDVCLGLPGSKPRVNKKAIEYGLKIAKALNCKIMDKIVFSRKSYFYPDMSKNYQITQYEIPLGVDGYLELDGFEVKIRRVHLEEDPAKLIHIGGSITSAKYVLVDYNRAGVPLCEIVTEPVFTTPKEARKYLQELENILEYLGVYVEGSMKSDVNVSVDGNPRVEIKNVSGFREVEKALQYEITRQKNLLKTGGKIIQETRAWDEDMRITKPLRTKETEEDYGYIFEPDLTPIHTWDVEIPELPIARMKRFIETFGINEKFARAIVSDKEYAEVYEKLCEKYDPKVLATWFSGPIKKELNYRDLKFRESPLTYELLDDFFSAVVSKKYGDPALKLIIRRMVDSGENVEEAVSSLGMNETRDLEKAIHEVIVEHKKAVEDYLKGRDEAINFLIGQVLRKVRGAGDPNEIREKIQKVIQNGY